MSAVLDPFVLPWFQEGDRVLSPIRTLVSCSSLIRIQSYFYLFFKSLEGEIKIAVCEGGHTCVSVYSECF